MDETDHRILSALCENGRASYSQIGLDVGLSPHGAADRIRRLEAAGAITGYTAKIDLGQIGRALDAFIDVRLLPSTDPDEFARTVGQLPAVRQLTFLTGRFDFLVRVACEDADELDTTVRTIRRDAGAAQTETRIALRTTNYEPLIPGRTEAVD